MTIYEQLRQQAGRVIAAEMQQKTDTYMVLKPPPLSFPALLVLQVCGLPWRRHIRLFSFRLLYLYPAHIWYATPPRDRRSSAPPLTLTALRLPKFMLSPRTVSAASAQTNTMMRHLAKRGGSHHGTKTRRRASAFKSPAARYRNKKSASPRR